jgi:ABC-type antimicrobial peptide transport system permease subunit
MVWKNLLRRKTRTLLTVIGIAIGVSAVVALGAIAEGFVNSYGTMLSSSGADIIVTQGDAADVILSAVDDNIAPQLMTMPGISKISGVLLGVISTPDVPYFVVFGLDPREFGIAHYKITSGAPMVASRQVLLGKGAAKNFKKQVGDNYKIQDVSFRIVGIYETGQNIEEMGAVISLQDAQEIFKKPRQVTFYQLKTLKPELTDSAIKLIEQRFTKLTASRSSTFMDDQQETQMLRAMGWVIGMFAVVAGGLVMMNTMLMSVFERTREIGVLRALGWRRGRVIRLILGEAMALSVAGGIVGVALGVGMIYGLERLPALAGFLENALSLTQIVQGFVIALCLGAVGGLYPAWHASNLQPVEAMRYDGVGTQSQTTIQFQFGGLAVRNILRQRTRTILTALAIGVGVGMAVALGGMAEGLMGQLGAIGSQSGELTITEAKASDMSLAAIDDQVGRWTAGLPEVKYVSGTLIGVTSMPGTPYFLAWGLDPTSYAIRHYAITEGDRIRTPREMLLGKVAAKNMKKHIGDTISISGNSFRVVGIYETGVSYEDGASVIPLSEAQRIFKKPNQVSFYFVKLNDPSQGELVSQKIQARWSQVSVSRSSDYAEKLNDMQTFRAMSNALSFLAILIGGVGIMNAMLMSVFERTREIGTLRALGWRRRRIVGMIVRESLLLSALSGVVGIALGVGLGSLLSLEPTMGAFLKGEYSPMLMAQAILVALILGALGALYPAWRASNLSPIEALRYE